MALIDDLNDVANNGDQVSHLWINAVANRFIELENLIQGLTTRVTTLEGKLNEFILSQGAGRIVNFTGGSILLPNGNTATIAPGSVTAPDNATSWIAIRQTGTNTAEVIATTDKPPITYKLGDVATVAGAITSLTQSPKLQRLLSEPMTVVQATKGNLTTLPADGISKGIPGWETIDVFSAFDPANGTFTVPVTDYYQVLAKTVLISDVISELKAKFWLASNSTEIALLGEVSAGVTTNAFRSVFNGFYEGELLAGQVITLQTQIDTAANARILADANTQFIIRRGVPR